MDTGPDTGGDDPAPAEEDLVRAAAAARQATQDSTAIAYIGELDSAATLTSLPITNDARLLQVSTGAGDVELVAPFEGSDEVPPETQTTGVRTFGTLARPRWRPGASWGRRPWRSCWCAIDRADDPLDRASVVEAFLATGERDSPLGLLLDRRRGPGRAGPVSLSDPSRSRSAGSRSGQRNSKPRSSARRGTTRSGFR